MGLVSMNLFKVIELCILEDEKVLKVGYLNSMDVYIFIVVMKMVKLVIHVHMYMYMYD